MKIVSFVVRLECGACKGQKMVAGGQLQYGELVPCATCDGMGTVPGYVEYADFAKLLHGLVRL